MTELFIGLIGPTGTDLAFVATHLQRALSRINIGGKAYAGEVVSVIGSLDIVDGLNDVAAAPPDQHILDGMDKGDEFCKRTDMRDALAVNSIQRIHELRIKGNQKRKYGGEGLDKPSYDPLENRAYILKSLKRPEEVDALREVYGDSFYAVSCYASRNLREGHLRRRIEQGHVSTPDDLDNRVSEIIDRDEKDKSNQFGQNVQDAFVKGDIFVDLHDERRAREQIERFVLLLFSHPYITPTFEEYAIFLAKAASAKSADLGRQVGAVITSPQGEIVSVGYNEVPKPGGGVYGPEDGANDFRDFREGGDTNAQWRSRIVHEIARVFKKEGLLSPTVDTDDEFETTERVLAALRKHDARVAQLIEFLRPIHAEMAAITAAARQGFSLQDTTLFCTTFPCHECARLIIASGIMRVVYIDPYPKSLTSQLYHRQVLVDPTPDEFPRYFGKGRVIFQQYMGIAPRMYLPVFPMDGKTRKDQHGHAIREDRIQFARIRQANRDTYIRAEVDATTALSKTMKRVGFEYKEAE